MNIIYNISNFFQNIQVEMVIDIIIAIMIVIVCKLFSGSISYAMIKVLKFKSSKKEIRRSSFYKPIKIFIVILGIYIATWLFVLPDQIVILINKAFRISVICLAANGFANVVSAKSTLFNFLKDKDKLPEDDTLVKFISKVVKTVIYAVAGFTISYELGFNLNGLIAGLGIRWRCCSTGSPRYC